jgi:hypothetical protein
LAPGAAAGGAEVCACSAGASKTSPKASHLLLNLLPNLFPSSLLLNSIENGLFASGLSTRSHCCDI